jgi:hypothetical protein
VGIPARRRAQQGPLSLPERSAGASSTVGRALSSTRSCNKAIGMLPAAASYAKIPCMPCLTRSLAILLMFVSVVSYAKKQEMVMLWPQDNPTLKLTFGTFHEMGSYAGKMTLVSDVVVENLTTKIMPRSSFSVSLLDRKNVRIGNGLLIVDDLNPGQSAKVQFQCTSVGQPAVLSIAARNSGGVPTSTRLIPVTIISVPPGPC